MNAPLRQCLQSAGLLVPPILHVALKGHKLAMIAAHLHNPGIQHAIPNMQIGARAMLKWH